MTDDGERAGGATPEAERAEEAEKLNACRGRFIEIFDTTLRDGEQTPGISFTKEQKKIIAAQLDKLGVNVIEAGFPISAKEEADAVKEICSAGLNAKICGLARAVSYTHLTLPTN